MPMKNLLEAAYRKQIYESLGWRCYYCGDKLTQQNKSIDHKTPVARGGSSEKFNLVPSCLSCNRAKRTLSLEDFRKKVAGVPKFNPEQIKFLSDAGVLSTVLTHGQKTANGVKFFGEEPNAN